MARLQTILSDWGTGRSTTTILGLATTPRRRLLYWSDHLNKPHLVLAETTEQALVAPRTSDFFRPSSGMRPGSEANKSKDQHETIKLLLITDPERLGGKREPRIRIQCWRSMLQY